MPTFLEGFSGSFFPSFNSSGQNFLNNRRADRAEKTKNRLLEDQLASSAQSRDLQLKQFESGQATQQRDLEAAEVAQQTEDAQKLQRALQIQGLVDQGRESGDLSEQDIGLINAAGGGQEQFDQLNSIFAGQAAAEAGAPQLALEQENIRAQIGQRNAAAEKSIADANAPPKLPPDIALLQALGVEPTLAGVKDLAQARSTKVNVGTGPKPPANHQFIDPSDPNLGVVPIKGSTADKTILTNLTEAQARSQGFASRTLAANEILSSLGAPDTEEAAQTVVAGTAGFIPGLISDTAGGAIENAIKSETAQSREQAQRDFVTAVLRKESGAVISDTEFKTEALKFFPLATDKPAVVKQKAESRARAIENLRREGGLDPKGDAKDADGPRELSTSSGISFKVRQK